MRMLLSRLLLATMTLPALFGYQASSTKEERVTADAAVILDFNSRVNEYMKVHKKAMGAVSNMKSTNSQEDIARHEKQLADRIRAARTTAHQGDIFTPAISNVLRRLLVAVTSGTNGVKVRQSLRRAEPVKLALAVNLAYPSTLPVQSTPPTLLANLPQLPKELEYRLVGQNLILRDVDANLIIDFLLKALQ